MGGINFFCARLCTSLRCAHGVRAPIDGKCRIVFSSSIPHSVRHTYYSTPITQLHETHSEALVVSPKTHEFAKAAFAGGWPLRGRALGILSPCAVLSTGVTRRLHGASKGSREVNPWMLQVSAQ